MGKQFYDEPMVRQTVQFKVGDRVRVVRSDVELFNGTTGTVIELDENDGLGVIVVVEVDRKFWRGSSQQRWSAHKLDLIEG